VDDGTSQYGAATHVEDMTTQNPTSPPTPPSPQDVHMLVSVQKQPTPVASGKASGKKGMLGRQYTEHDLRSMLERVVRSEISARQAAKEAGIPIVNRPALMFMLRLCKLKKLKVLVLFMLQYEELGAAPPDPRFF
jgi:hypothetical protein